MANDGEEGHRNDEEPRQRPTHAVQRTGRLCRRQCYTPPMLQLADLSGLDYVDEDVPFRLLETDDVALLANADDIAVEDHFRTSRAGWAE